MNTRRGGVLRFTRVGPLANLSFNLILIILSAACIIPFILVVSISFSDEQAVFNYGYHLIPKVVSLEGYKYLWELRSVMLNAFGMSVLVTASGTVLGLILNSSLGYVLYRREFFLKRFYIWLVFIPMVFSGGMVAGYFMMTQVLQLRNNPLALILPSCVSSFNIIIFRTFFRTTIPDSVVESAMIDGAGHWTIFFRIVLPLSLPVLATIGLFLSFNYWNDWFGALLYITDSRFYTLSAYLNKILENISTLAQNTQMLGASRAELLARLPAESARMGIVIITVLPIVCTYPFFQRYFISGLTIGAIKG
jgi:putative aldouronate transport system permease protein